MISMASFRLAWERVGLGSWCSDALATGNHDGWREQPADSQAFVCPRESTRIRRAAVPYCRAEEPVMLRIDVEREEDGRWIGEVTALPGVMAYGTTELEARQRVAALALRVSADRIEHGEPVPEEAALFALA